MAGSVLFLQVNEKNLQKIFESGGICVTIRQDELPGAVDLERVKNAEERAYGEEHFTYH